MSQSGYAPNVPGSSRRSKHPIAQDDWWSEGISAGTIGIAIAHYPMESDLYNVLWQGLTWVSSGCLIVDAPVIKAA